MVVLSLGTYLPDFLHPKTQCRLSWESYFTFYIKEELCEGCLTLESAEMVL